MICKLWNFDMHNRIMEQKAGCYDQPFVIGKNLNRID